MEEVPGRRINIVRADISVIGVEKRSGRKGPHPGALVVPAVLGLLAVGVGVWWL